MEERLAKTMKRGSVFILTFVLVVLLYGVPARLEKSALLTLPAMIENPKDIVLFAAFRWDETAPVLVPTVVIDGRVCTYGEVKIFSEDGNEMPMLYPVTMPLVPTGTVTVSTGEVLRVGLYTLSFVKPLKPGSYYAVATFSDAFCGGQNVRFTTKKRWFQAGNAKPKVT